VKSLNKSSDAAPLYTQIKKDIKFKITCGVWQQGMKIPTELELCKQYDVSRITLRKAIEELVNEGLLIRERPLGTFVAKKEFETNEEPRTYIKSITNEMREVGIDIVTIDLELNVKPADIDLATKLDVPIQSPVIELLRIRGVKNNPIAYFKTYFPYLDTYSLDPENYKGSFYEYLRTQGIMVTDGKELLTAIMPDQEIMEKLNIDSNVAVLKRVRLLSQNTAQYREYSECYYIGEKYSYFVNLS
jgi:GntR family transcriptional regulator